MITVWNMYIYLTKRHTSSNKAKLIQNHIPWGQRSVLLDVELQPPAESLGGESASSTSSTLGSVLLLLPLHLQPLGSGGRQSAVQQTHGFHWFVCSRLADTFSFQRDDVRKQRRRPQTEACSLRPVNSQQQLIALHCCHSHPACRESARDGQVRQVRHWRCCRWCLWSYLQMTVWCQQQPPGNPDPPNWTPEEPMQETPSCAPSLRQAPERSTHTSINNHKHSKAALCRAHATHPQQHVSTVFLINAVGFFQASDVNRHPIGGHDRKPAGLFSLWRTAWISSLSIIY